MCRSLAGICLLFLVSCGDGNPSLTDAPAALSGRLAIGESNEDQAKRIITRGIALALNDGDERARLWIALRESRRREGRLWLDEWILQGRNDELVRKISHKLELTSDSVLVLLRTLPELDLYLPLDAHRSDWGGDTEYWVVAEASPDELAYGYNSAGEERVFTVNDPVPDSAVLAIMLPEGISTTEASPQLRSDSIAMSSTYDDVRLVLLQSQLGELSLYEPMWKGDPEIEIHTGVHVEDENQYWYCASEWHERGSYKFNQDGSTWAGEVTLNDNFGGLLESGYPFWLELWENDDITPCKRNGEDHINGYREAISVWQGATFALALMCIAAWEDEASDIENYARPDSSSALRDKCIKPGAQAFAVLAMVNREDDWIGQATLPTTGCMPHWDGQQWIAVWNGDQNVAALEVEIRGRLIEVCDHIHMWGPANIYSEGSYSWEATPKGGEGNYIYQWYYMEPGEPTGSRIIGATEPVYSRYVGAPGDFKLKVEVTGPGDFAASGYVDVGNHISDQGGGCEPPLLICE